jgi:hypothetical protein
LASAKPQQRNVFGRDQEGIAEGSVLGSGVVLDGFVCDVGDGRLR